MLRKFFNRNESTIFLAALMAVLCMVLIPMFAALPRFLAHPVVNPYLDSDWRAVNLGINGIHSFRDTIRWWTGDWAGPFLYWRPLMSYTWLGLAHIWKPGYMLPREILLFVLHIAYLILCGLFLYKLTGRKWLALLAVYIYAGWVPSTFGGTSASVVALLYDPKNIPDPLSAICIVISLILLVDERYYLALIPACLGVLFKEIGFVVWPIVPVVLLILKRWKRIPWPAAAAWTAALALLGIAHYLAIGIGYRMSGNENWYVRMLNFHLGPVVMSFLSPNASEPITAAMLILVLRATRGRSPILVLLGVLGAFAVGVVVNCFVTHIPPAEGFAGLVDVHLRGIIYCTMWLGIFYMARRELFSAFPYFIMAVIAAAPTWAALQVLAHTRYESDLFAAAFMAIVLSGAARTLVRFVSGLNLSEMV